MKVNIPEKWSEITLRQFQKYNVEVRKDINETTKLIQTISTLCNISFEDTCKMSIKDITKLSGYISELLQLKPETHIMIFEYKGVKYGFIPKLDDISIGEYADLEYYLSDTENMWNNMHWIMSILYREIEEEKDGKYRIAEYTPCDKRANLFKDIGMNVVYSASNFFLTLGGELLEIIGNSTQNKKEILNQLKEMNGGGSKLSTI
tara:strand:- start:1245 stop:1859 length:615 start_codon:yes stop_codon:yes gene_type:complete